MALGLQRGIVRLCPHDPAWETLAEECISELKELLGSCAPDIQHVGSTSVRAIRAKPILDIAVAVKELDDIFPFLPVLAEHGYIRRNYDNAGEVFLVCGVEEQRTHYIHVVPLDSPEWRNYLRFRDYLNRNEEAARRYEARKLELSAEFPEDRASYTEGKAELIRVLLDEAERAERSGL